MSEQQDLGIRLTTNDGEYTSGIDKAIAKLGELDKAANSTNKNLTEGWKSAIDSQDQFQEETAGTVTAIKDVNAEQKEANKTLANSIKNYKVFGVSINDVQNKMKSFAASSKIASAAIGGSTKALKLFRLAVIGTGIGALLIAFVSLITFFTKSQKGIDILNQKLAGLGSIVNNITDIFIGFGETIFDAVTKPQEALESLGRGIVNFLVDPAKAVGDAWDRARYKYNEFKEEFRRSGEIEAGFQAIRKKTAALDAEVSKSRAQIKELNKTAEDTTKSFKERGEAAEKAIQIENDLLQKRISLQIREVALIKLKNSQSTDDDADLQAVYDAEVKLANLKSESQELQTTLQNKLNAIRAESIRKTEALRKAYNDLFDDLQQQLTENEIEEADPLTRLLLIQKQSISGLEEQRDKLIEIATITGGDVQKVKDGYATLIQSIRDATDEEIEKLKSDRTVDPLDIIGLPNEVIAPKITIDAEITPSKSFEDKLADFKKTLIDALGISDEEAEILSDGVQFALNNIYSNIVADVDRKIDQNNRYRDDLENDIDTLEDKLEREDELNRLGAANDYDLLAKQLSDKKELQDQANKEAEELQKKRAKAELIQNISSQISNLTTAASKVFSATSGIPFVGIPLALGFIASMYGAFKAFKAQAQADIKLFEGAQRVGDYFGYVQKGGPSDIPGRGKGLRIEGTNTYLGGNEMISTEDAARVQGALIMDINRNPKKYEGVDVKAALDSYKATAQNLSNVSGVVKDIQMNNITIEQVKNDKMIKEAIELSSQEIVKAIKERPHIFASGDKQVKVVNGKREIRSI